MQKLRPSEQALTVAFVLTIACLFVVQAKVTVQQNGTPRFSLEKMNLAFGYGSSSSSVSLECGEGSGADDAMIYNDHCYLLYKNNDSNWSQAKAACATYNGSYLASITDVNEQNALDNLDFEVSPGGTWIGLNDVDSEGTFVWDSGEPFSYSHWYSGEPNDQGGEDCVWLIHQSLKTWNDGGCSTAQSNVDYLCEFQISACGNGSLEGLEECDDGDMSSGDGCSAACEVESGWSCTGTVPSVCSEVCGNGVVTSGEQCDDGNTSNGDGCSSSCTEQSGWSCTGSPSSCETECGDGITAGAEACDDGNDTDTDSCRNSCVFASCGDSVVQESGADGIPGNADDETCDDGGESATCDDNCSAVACGDQNVNQAAGETCDDGNSSNLDGCLNSCVTASCGDGYTRTGVEQCEPPGVGVCNVSCQESAGIGVVSVQVSSSSTSRAAPPKNCGNGIVETSLGEKCDEGRFNGLSPLCDLWCNTTFCGDGLVQVSVEECEPLRQGDGTFVAQTCGGKVCTIPICSESASSCAGGCGWVFLPACKVSSSSSQQSIDSSVVTDGVSSMLVGAASSSAAAVQPTSVGASLSSTASSAVVTPAFSLPAFSIGLSTSSISRSAVSSVICGNGIREGAEMCDDGPRNSNTLPDSCRLTCKLPVCGDAVVDQGEACDDGNDIIGDGCTPLCTRSACGNSVLEPGEECDDGPLNSATKPDSCSDRCLLPRCGDAVLDAAFGEQCDQGTDNSNVIADRCRLNCLRPHCGDGIMDGGEECDDGNSSNLDSCSISCKKIGCGNGVKDWNEACDDGNKANGDGCSSSCLVESKSFFQWLNEAIRLPFGW